MCRLCDTIQTNLSAIKHYDKSKELIRRELYLNFDNPHYEFNIDDLIKIVDLFAFKKSKAHHYVVSTATELFYYGCEVMATK